MKIKLTSRYVLAFLALLFVMHELHEIVHTTVGRFICGCWGQRDFNVWSLCNGCSEDSKIGLIATLAGPLFTFAMIWIGYYFLKKNSLDLKSFGFSLIFANMPFGRLLSAMLNSGDEVYILKSLGVDGSITAVTTTAIIISIILIPLIEAYRSIENRKRILWFVAFLFLPLTIDILLVLVLMNSLLAKGILDEYWILGSPLLVSLWTFLVLFVLILTYKNLYRIHDM